MNQEFTSKHYTDDNGNPNGGCSTTESTVIHWQRGTVKDGVPNGAFVETVIKMAADRLMYYQSTKFKCYENTQAIVHLQKALGVLGVRTARRRDAGTENTHVPEPQPEDANDDEVLPTEENGGQNGQGGAPVETTDNETDERPGQEAG